ncbi:hypothetical protein AND_002341 [Anopheles darlingi]|uniref:Uncharacterized protein n=1 Tax=Anopheles darlingi TaxID=43151 RepID=W5JRF3_ANODA|nr:hypothetical protein AND_002341 [Anopheles darlingi]
MSLLMMAAVMLGWSRTLRTYMVYLWIRYLFCLGLWLIIWKAFGNSEQISEPYMPFSVWCLVLLLFSGM